MNQQDLRVHFLAAHESAHSALTIEIGQRYLSLYPDDAWVLVFVGMALQAVARYAEASEAFERALPLLPSDRHWRIFLQLGQLERARFDSQAAEHWYRRAIEASPNDATGHIYLGALLAVGGKLDEAEAAHRRAVSCSEGCIDEAYLNLGYVLRAKRLYLDALHCFREALARDPLDTEAQLALADMEKVLFEFPEA